MSVLPFNYSCSEGKPFVLLRPELEDVDIQIGAEPYKDNYGQHDKARTIFHCRKKGQQKKPKGNIICDPNNGERVSAPLFD